MNTKKAIEFINDLEIYIHDDYPEFREYKEAFIALLQQGEKFEDIWEELYQDCTFLESVEKMHDLKQKYFPKSETKEGEVK